MEWSQGYSVKFGMQVSSLSPCVIGGEKSSEICRLVKGRHVRDG
jgi:hypothetical protein